MARAAFSARVGGLAVTAVAWMQQGCSSSRDAPEICVAAALVSFPLFYQII